MKLHRSPWRVDLVEPLPAVVGGSVVFLSSCIEKMLAIPLGMYHTFSPPYEPISLVVTAPALHDLDPVPHGFNSLEVLVRLEGRNCGASVEVRSVVRECLPLYHAHIQ